MPLPPSNLVAPPEQDPVDVAIEEAERMIEESIADGIAIAAGGTAAGSRCSHRGGDYDAAWAQGRKDACRVLLVALRGSEHITSDDVKRARRDGA